MVPEKGKDGLRRYHMWAGHPQGEKEDTTRCIEEVCAAGRAILFYQCNRKRGFGPGNLYCKQHDPVEVKRRAAEVEARWKAKQAARAHPYQQAADGLVLADALLDIDARMNWELMGKTMPVGWKMILVPLARKVKSGGSI